MPSKVLMSELLILISVTSAISASVNTSSLFSSNCFTLVRKFSSGKLISEIFRLPFSSLSTNFCTTTTKEVSASPALAVIVTLPAFRAFSFMPSTTTMLGSEEVSTICDASSAGSTLNGISRLSPAVNWTYCSPFSPFTTNCGSMLAKSRLREGVTTCGCCCGVSSSSQQEVKPVMLIAKPKRRLRK